jgi:ketosteroid isomerase-like protein
MKPSPVIAAVALLLLSFAAYSQVREPSPALASLVESERAFARTSVERGVRESFLAFFAEDGINFQPGPVKTRAAILSRPAPAVRPPVTLDWWPVFADASSAGDLGFTTGPYVFSDDAKKRPPDYGCYFSVWRRQSDGAWRVVLDLGVPTAAPCGSQTKSSEFTPAKPLGWKPGKSKPDAAATLADLRAAEKEFSALAANGNVDLAFDKCLTDDARFYRGGTLPVVGARAIGDYLRRNVAKFSWEMIGGGAASSGDFGYTYGSYDLTPAGATDGRIERGYYARVWKRDVRGRWRAVMNVAHAAAKDQE